MYYWVLFGIFLTFFFFNLVAGSKPKKEQAEIFHGRMYVEDGVMGVKDVPNSKEALEHAISLGYGIKTEVIISSDDVPFIADTNKFKVSGKGREKRVAYTLSDELKRYGYMTLKEFLALVDGRVPVILEFVKTDGGERICKNSYKHIKAYNEKHVGSGKTLVAVCSYNALLMDYFKQNAKELYHGVIANTKDEYPYLSNLRAGMAANLMEMSVCRAQFALYINKKENFWVRTAYKFGIGKGVWGITNKENLRSYIGKKDMIVFKGFVPEE